MEGFLNFRMRPWLRRLVTRALAIVPAAFTIYFAGDQSTFGLLILSQVILSMQLPFAVIPLIHFTSDRARMGSFANSAVGPRAGLVHGRRDRGLEPAPGLAWPLRTGWPRRARGGRWSGWRPFPGGGSRRYFCCGSPWNL